MSNNFDANETINSMYEKIEKLLQTKTVVGESIKVGEATIIPLISVSFGVGAGGGDGSDEKGMKGVGGGGGSGAKITPAAVLVIIGDQVQMLPVTKSRGLEKLLDMIPDIMNKAKESKCCE